MDTINTMINEFDSLELSQKKYFFNIIKNRLLSSDEDILLNRVLEVEENFKIEKVKIGSVNDLFKDLDD